MDVKHLFLRYARLYLCLCVYVDDGAVIASASANNGPTVFERKIAPPRSFIRTDERRKRIGADDDNVSINELYESSADSLLTE